MRRAVLLALALAACGPQVERPPPQFQGDRDNVKVSFVADPDQTCRTPTAGEGEILGCEMLGRIWVKNPCLETGAYAEVLCHELGHVNGYRHD